ncbi:hypothetical protein SDC9_61503 [bioreactor metagenome]|uniref:Uncharacterized protein n=1 Tax=bioreactor metagenome TaxID=1076179 RepID=A0A644XGU2_9ZZZZ
MGKVQTQCLQCTLAHLDVLLLRPAEQVGFERIRRIRYGVLADKKPEIRSVDGEAFFQVGEQHEFIADQEGAIAASHPGSRPAKAPDHGKDGALLLHPGKSLEQVEHNNLTFLFRQCLKEQRPVGGKREHRLEVNSRLYPPDEKG